MPAAGYAAGAAQRRALGETSASIAILNPQTSQIVFAYSAGKMGTNQLQKTAEDCAHLKESIEKCRSRRNDSAEMSQKKMGMRRLRYSHLWTALALLA